MHRDFLARERCDNRVRLLEEVVGDDLGGAARI